MRRLVQMSLARPISAVMAVLAFALLGAIAASNIPISLMPHSAFPGLTVEIRYGGVGPEKMEQLITRPIEEAVSAIGGIEELSSVSEEGRSRVDIQFARGTDLNFKAMEVRERIEVVAAAFPREVQSPALLRYDPDRSPVMIVSLENIATNQAGAAPGREYSLSELREIAERDTKKALEGVEGISEIIVAGGQMREIIAEIDRDLLRSRGLAMNDVLRRLQESNLDASLGEIFARGGSYPLLATGRFGSLAEIRALVLKTDREGRPVRLGDVSSSVDYGYRDQDTASRLDGEERVSVYIHKAGNSNLLQLSDDVRAILDARSQAAAENSGSGTGPALRFNVVYDQADQIRRILRNLAISTALGALFVGVGLYFAFASLRVAALVLGAVPLSGLIAAFFLYLGDFEYNLITLSGLVLSVGISLLLLTLSVFHIRRYGATAAAGAIGQELIAGVVVLSAIFLPVTLAGEDLRVVYGGLAVAVIVPVLATLLLCNSLLPVLLGRRELRRYQVRPLVSFADRLRAASHQAKFAFDRTIYRQFPLRLYDWLTALDRRRSRLWLAYAGILCLGLLIYSISGRQYAVGLNRNYVNAQVEFPSGTSFGATNGTAKKVEGKIQKVPGVAEVTSRVEAAKATIRIRLAAGESADEAKLAELREAVGKNEPAFVFFGTDAEAGSLREITIHVLGEDLAVLDKITRQMADQAKNLPGVSQVVLRYKSPRPEMRLIVNRVKAEQAGLTPSSFGDTVRFAIQGAVATKYFEEDREVDVRIRYAARFRQSLSDLGELFLKALGQNGGFVPALEIARIEEGKVPVKIYHQDKKRAFGFSLQSAGAIDELIGPVQELRKLPLPENYRIEFGREFRQALESRRRFLTVNLLSLLLVFMILAAYFESLRRPLMLFAVLPVPIAVVLLMLYILGQDLSITIMIALLILASLVAMQAMLWLRFTGPGSENRSKKLKNKLKFVGKPAARLRPYGTMLRSDAPLYLLAGGLVVLFLLPLTVLIADGGEFLRGMALCLTIGVAVSCVSTPLLATLLATEPGGEGNSLQQLRVWLVAHAKRLQKRYFQG